MKKIMLLCMATLIMVAMSCKKDEDVVPEDEEIPEDCFQAMLEKAEDGKTYLEGTKVTWKKNDSIMVFNSKGEKAGFVLVRGSKTDLGVFSKFTPGDFDMKGYPIVSVYPYAPNLELEGDTLTGITIKNFHLPSTQILTNESFGSDANPMTAISNEPKLYFKNVCGVLRVQLKGTAVLKSISVTDPTNMPLWGDGTLTLDHTTGISKLSPLSNGTNIVKLYSDIGVKLNFDSKNFYIVLPTGALRDGFVAEAKQGESSDGSIITVMKKTATVSNTIHRTKIRVMPIVENVLEIRRDECVDLNNSENIFWCKRNVGAYKETLIGGFISWGNVDCHWLEGEEDMESFSQETYNRSEGCVLSHSIVQGNIYDPAARSEAAGWMIPTKKQYEELLNMCSWKFGWNTFPGMSGWIISNPNNPQVKVFFPCSGRVYDDKRYEYQNDNLKGYYWCSTIGSDKSKATCINLSTTERFISEEPRYHGLNVRPICYYSYSY